ncbi:hypothetical protein JX265_002608 [Neoarthrinium moseri]|uniref:Response regulatory domain-containing protein n=1 Tax=Neoarthrinium moseri TaxID=1658444 RepID=A0A9Q0AQJ5_9PEZI|nr:hypothetical protein JX265_002608 [Neoarthrinium moseri]
MADIQGPSTPLGGGPPSPLLDPLTALGLLPPPGFTSVAIPLPRGSLYLRPLDTPRTTPSSSSSSPAAAAAFITASPSSIRPTVGARRRLPAPSKPEPNGAYTLLIVDDNPIQRKIVSKICERWGQPYELAENGQQAVDMYKRNPERYRCILMDLVMPVLDGFEATKQIRAFEEESWNEATSSSSFLSPSSSSSSSLYYTPSFLASTRQTAATAPDGARAPPPEPVRRAVIIALVPGYAITGLRQRIADTGFDLSLSHPLHLGTLSNMLFSGPEANVVSLYGGVDARRLREAGYPLQPGLRKPSTIGQLEVGEVLGMAVV